MGRAPCCDSVGLKKGPWTSEEDRKLVNYVQTHGPGNWRTLPKKAGLERCGKSCRLRWTNYLRPDIKRGRISFEEEEAIIQLHSLLGNKWSEIASRLPGRTDNEIKNYWNTHIKKRLLKMGIDPVTHSPRLDLSSILNAAFCNQLSLLNLSNLIGNSPEALNSDLLRLLSILAVSKQEIPSSSFAGQVQENHQLLIDSDMCQWRNCYQNPAPEASSPEIIGQIMQPNVDLVSSSTLSTSTNFYTSPTSDQNLVTSEFSEFFTNQPNFTSGNGFSDHVISQLPENLDLGSLSHIVYDSTPLSSSSPYIYSTSTEDEKESYNSSLFHFEIPEGFDMDDFL